MPSFASVETTGINIAHLASCTQSSLSEWSTSNSEADNLVNNPRRMGEYVQHTEFEDCPWIELDFGSPVHYDEILVFNRLSQAGRARTLTIDISMDGEGWHRIHSSNPDAPAFGGTDGNPLRVLTPGYEARYFRFQLQEPNFLHLVAIEIYCQHH